MPSCAFLTLENSQGWFMDDELVHQHLRDLGWNISDIPWKSKADWNCFDAIVIRSTWDYQSDIDRFRHVLQQIEDSKALLLNPLEMVLWNINKNYLFELQDRGIVVVPTIKVDSPELRDFEQAFVAYNTDEIIAKPVVGANADDTFRIRENATELDQICKTFHNRTCLLQPFLKNIVDEGEYSLIFIDGQFTHSVVKGCGTGDFRVQEEHGGSVLSVEQPEIALLEAGRRVISTLHQTPLYARVDLVRMNDQRFALMELELIEPGLFFKCHHPAAKLLAIAIDKHFTASKSE